MNVEPLVRDEDNSTCPFYGQLPAGKRHVCLSRSNDVIAISPRYVDSYCLTSQHVRCNLFLHADEAARVYVADLRDRQTAARAPVGAMSSGSVGSHPLEAMLTPVDVVQVETIRGQDAGSESPKIDAVQPLHVKQHEAVRAVRLAEQASGDGEEIPMVPSLTDGEASVSPSSAHERVETETAAEMVEPVRGEATEVGHQASLKQRAVSMASAQPASAAGAGGREPRMPIDVASVPAESTTPREVSPEPVPAAPAEKQPIPVESVPVDTSSGDVTAPVALPQDPPVIRQERTMQTTDSVADRVDGQAENDSTIAAVDIPDRPHAVDTGPDTLLSAPEIVAPADHSTATSSSIVFVGMAEPDCTVRLYDWTVPVAEDHTDAEGRWNLTLYGVQDGTHLYTAQAMHADGGVSLSSRACTVTVQAERRPLPPADQPRADGWTLAPAPAKTLSRRTVALALAILLLLAAIIAVVLWFQGSSHRHPAPTTTRRPAPAVARPAPAAIWHFPAVRGPAQQVIVTLSNRYPSTVTVQVISHGSLVQRVQIPPKNGAEIELPPRVARMPLTIRATGLVLPQRLVMNGSRVRPSYGIPGL